MNQLQKTKRNIRQSKVYKLFKHKLNVLQKGIDPILQNKLKNDCQLHHREITATEDDYQNFSKEDDFVLLNKTTHKFLHWLYPFWKSDPSIIQRLISELEKLH